MSSEIEGIYEQLANLLNLWYQHEQKFEEIVEHQDVEDTETLSFIRELHETITADMNHFLLRLDAVDNRLSSKYKELSDRVTRLCEKMDKSEFPDDFWIGVNNPI